MNSHASIPATPSPKADVKLATEMEPAELICPCRVASLTQSADGSPLEPYRGMMPWISANVRSVLRLESRDRGTSFPPTGRKLVIVEAVPGGRTVHGTSARCPWDMGTSRTVYELSGGVGGGNPNRLRRCMATFPPFLGSIPNLEPEP
jgi:hypothetical protein